MSGNLCDTPTLRMRGIKSVSKESRVFDPPPAFAERARVGTREADQPLCDRCIRKAETSMSAGGSVRIGPEPVRLL